MKYIFNKSKQLKYNILLLFCIITTVPVAEGQVSHTLNFDASKLTNTTETIGGLTYTRLQYPGTFNCTDPGAPELPVLYLQFSVPYNATDFSVMVTTQNQSNITLADQLYPVQPLIQGNKSVHEQPFILMDSIISGSDQYWPSTPAKIINDGFYDGDNHILTVAVYPFCYLPSAKQLKLYGNINLNISYSSQRAARSANNEPQSMSISRPLPAQRRAGRDIVKQFVVNPNQVDGFSPNTARAKTRSVSNLPVYEYCVITNRELAPAFDRLIAWKRQKGYSAGVVCIEDILSDPDTQGGDPVSFINDDAGKLRAYLRNAYYNDGSAKYVLLGGKGNIVPIRYGCGTNYSPSQTVSSDYNIPTDLYYSDLNGSWNVDGDSHYGEPAHDAVDFYPELYVGRLLCSTKDEVYNYTEKLLRYETNPGNGNPDYLKRAFYTQSDGMQYYHEADTASVRLSNAFPHSLIYQEWPSYNDPSPTWPSGNQVVNEMNVLYGFISLHAHGSPEGIGAKSNGDNADTAYGVSSLQGQVKYFVPENANGLDNMINEDYPTILYTTACTTTPYDIYHEGNVIFDDIKYNAGESFTVGGLYGGPAFLGNTRNGYYGGVNSSLGLELGFAKCLNNGNYNIGIAEANSKTPAITPNISMSHYLRLTHNLIGCPEFEIWTGNTIPYVYLSFMTVTNNDNSITIWCNHPYAAGSKVSAMSKWGYPVINIITSTLTLSDISLNRPITVYKHNCIPHILPLKLQNESITESQYLFAGTVSIGRSVDTYRTQGNYAVTTGVNLTIEATEAIDIQPGFIVQSGGKVIQKSKSNVSINGGEIQNGGSLVIDAVTTNITKDFQVDMGGALEIK